MIQKQEVDITLENNIFFITGDLNFYNVTAVFQKSLLHLKKLSLSGSTSLHFDFSKLNSCDSAGIALVIEWIKFSNQRKLSICFSHFPKNLLSITKAARIDSLIQ